MKLLEEGDTRVAVPAVVPATTADVLVPAAPVAVIPAPVAPPAPAPVVVAEFVVTGGEQWYDETVQEAFTNSLSHILEVPAEYITILSIGTERRRRLAESTEASDQALTVEVEIKVPDSLADVRSGGVLNAEEVSARVEESVEDGTLESEMTREIATIIQESGNSTSTAAIFTPVQLLSTSTAIILPPPSPPLSPPSAPPPLAAEETMAAVAGTPSQGEDADPEAGGLPMATILGAGAAVLVLGILGIGFIYRYRTPRGAQEEVRSKGHQKTGLEQQTSLLSERGSPRGSPHCSPLDGPTPTPSGGDIPVEDSLRAKFSPSAAELRNPADPNSATEHQIEIAIDGSQPAPNSGDPALAQTGSEGIFVVGSGSHSTASDASKAYNISPPDHLRTGQHKRPLPKMAVSSHDEREKVQPQQQQFGQTPANVAMLDVAVVGDNDVASAGESALPSPHLINLSTPEASVTELQASGEDVSYPNAEAEEDEWARIDGLEARISGGSSDSFAQLRTNDDCDDPIMTSYEQEANDRALAERLVDEELMGLPTDEFDEMEASFEKKLEHTVESPVPVFAPSPPLPTDAPKRPRHPAAAAPMQASEARINELEQKLDALSKQVNASITSVAPTPSKDQSRDPEPALGGGEEASPRSRADSFTELRADRPTGVMAPAPPLLDVERSLISQDSSNIRNKEAAHGEQNIVPCAPRTPSPPPPAPEKTEDFMSQIASRAAAREEKAQAIAAGASRSVAKPAAARVKVDGSAAKGSIGKTEAVPAAAPHVRSVPGLAKALPPGPRRREYKAAQRDVAAVEAEAGMPVRPSSAAPARRLSAGVGMTPASGPMAAIPRATQVAEVLTLQERRGSQDKDEIPTAMFVPGGGGPTPEDFLTAALLSDSADLGPRISTAPSRMHGGDSGLGISSGMTVSAAPLVFQRQQAHERNETLAMADSLDMAIKHTPTASASLGAPNAAMGYKSTDTPSHLGDLPPLPPGARPSPRGGWESPMGMTPAPGAAPPVPSTAKETPAAGGSAAAAAAAAMFGKKLPSQAGWMDVI